MFQKIKGGFHTFLLQSLRIVRGIIIIEINGTFKYGKLYNTDIEYRYFGSIAYMYFRAGKGFLYGESVDCLWPL